MLEQVAGMFDNMKPMLKKVKKKSYEQNMKDFKHQYGICIDDMLVYIEKCENKEEAAKEAGAACAFIPKENWKENYGKLEIKVIPVETVQELLEQIFLPESLAEGMEWLKEKGIS